MIQEQGWAIAIRNEQGLTAQWSARALQINPTAFVAKPHPFPISLLVHEYHHVLVQTAASVYEDEFIAHWKQYEVEGVPLAVRAQKINYWLLEDPKGYRRFINPKPTTMLAGPQNSKHWHEDNRG